MFIFLECAALYHNHISFRMFARTIPNFCIYFNMRGCAIHYHLKIYNTLRGWHRARVAPLIARVAPREGNTSRGWRLARVTPLIARVTPRAGGASRG